MKSTKVKGFTLVELLIVMAVFSLIMFGALQMVEPSSRLFTRSFNEESVSAAQTNIRNYLENTLRYVQYISIRNQEPEHDDLVYFVNSHYNGKIDKDGHATSGTVYVMCIDNTQGGKISLKEYPYTAGDIKPVNVYDATADGTATIDMASVVSTEWCINKAMYKDFNFMISPMVTTTQTISMTDASGKTVVKKVLLKDDQSSDSYYQTFTDANLRTFSASNFVFTINAYKGKYADLTPVSTTDTRLCYDDVISSTMTMSLTNVLNYAPENYLHYWYNNEGILGYVKQKKDGSDQLFYDNRVNEVAYRRCTSNAFSPYTGLNDAVEPEKLYLIYTYPVFLNLFTQVPVSGHK